MNLALSTLLLLAVSVQQAPTTAPPRAATRPGPSAQILELFPPGVAYGGTTATDGRYVIFSAVELAQDADLNGDGDLADHVLHVADLVSGSIVNVGVSGSTNFHAGSDWGDDHRMHGGQFAFSAREADNGDLNGDGDATDQEGMVYDCEAGALRRSHTRGHPYVTGGAHALLLIEEHQVPKADLNGDGDMLDDVLLDWRLSTGTLTDLDLDAQSPAHHRPQVSVATYLLALAEASTGDRNGDGDALDSVLHVLHLEDGQVVNTGRAGSWLLADGGLEAFLVDESAQGAQDLNGDADALDSVLHLYDVASATLRNLALPGQNIPLAGGYPATPIRLAPGRAAFLVSESQEGNGGADLNGDGDLSDGVLFVHSFAANQTVNLAVASFDYALSSRYLAYHVVERWQGAGSLNGDADLDDFVLSVRELASGETAATGIVVADWQLFTPAFLPFTCTERGVAFELHEPGQELDANGDGDQQDFVHQRYDAETNAVVNTAVASYWDESSLSNSAIASHAFVFTVSEDGQGVDLTGDGDLDDATLVAEDLHTGRRLFTGFETLMAGSARGERMLLVPNEASYGADLNGDGDLSDNVLVRARVRP